MRERTTLPVSPPSYARNAVLFSGAVNEQEAQVMHAMAGKLRARGLSVTECVSADGHEPGPGEAPLFVRKKRTLMT